MITHTTALILFTCRDITSEPDGGNAVARLVQEANEEEEQAVQSNSVPPPDVLCRQIEAIAISDQQNQLAGLPDVDDEFGLPLQEAAEGDDEAGHKES